MLVREGTKNKKVFSTFSKRVFVFCSLFFCLLILAAPALAQAPGINTGIEQFGQYTALAQTDVRIIVAKIIRVALGLVGIVLVGFTIYGGYLYMTAGGNEEQINTAKKILKNMVIGLGIILSAFAITQFIINMLTGQTGGGITTEGESAFSEDFRIGGALGQVIESHYPMRDATGIPRNTKIVITFREKIDPATLIENTNGSAKYGDLVGNVSDQINSANVKIYRTADGETSALGLNPTDAADDVYAYLTADERTIVFKPVSYIGNPKNDESYTVKLTSNVKLADGRPAFPNSYYRWQFTVSPFVDLTPPRVESVVPMPSTGEYPRNILVQINFNEAVDPVSASGFYTAGDPDKDFQNITATVSAALLNGSFHLTNQYRTVEFKTTDECGKDPCGQSIFCLPPKATVRTTAKAATVDATNPPQAQIVSTIYDGVVDMAGNSLDGGGELSLDNGVLKQTPGPNGKAEGSALDSIPGVDDFIWSFKTSDQIHFTAPKLTTVTPVPSQELVTPSTTLKMNFDEIMSMGTFNEIRLKTDKDFNVWYTARAVNYDAAGNIVTSTTQIPVKTAAELWHGDFWRSQSPDDQKGAQYFPFIPSLVTDAYQICYYRAVGPGSDCKDLPAPGKLDDMTPSCANTSAVPGASLCAAGDASCPYPSVKP